MQTFEVERTLVKSPPELWDELCCEPGLARWLGDVSYGAFLWHFPLILLFSHTLGWVEGSGDRPYLMLLALVLPSAFFFGWLSRRFVEEPAIAWARSRTRSRD